LDIYIYKTHSKIQMQDLRAKVAFARLDLSAFLVSTLVHGLQLKNTATSFKADDSKPQILGVELQVSGPNQSVSNIYGEITICDFLVGVKNAEEGNRALMRQGDNLNYDHLVHLLNTTIRVAVSDFLAGNGSEQAVAAALSSFEANHMPQ
jgi:hypothetical protein